MYIYIFLMPIVKLFYLYFLFFFSLSISGYTIHKSSSQTENKSQTVADLAMAIYT